MSCRGVDRGAALNREAISDAWNSLDSEGSFGIISGEFAELADAAVDGVVADGQSTPAADHEIVL
jgi:hypothetical protein